MKKAIVLIITFYILVLFQTSFLPHFNFKGFTPNLVVITIILLNFFEKPAGKIGLFPAIFSGFLLDIVSEGFFGFWIVIIVAVSVFIKYPVKRYIQPAIRIG